MTKAPSATAAMSAVIDNQQAELVRLRRQVEEQRAEIARLRATLAEKEAA